MSTRSEEVWENFDALWRRVQALSRRVGELEERLAVIAPSEVDVVQRAEFNTAVSREVHR